MYFPIIDALKESYIAKIPSIVTKWLTDNVNPVGSAVVVDESLSISGAAADAKVTGDKLSNLKSDLSVDSDIINKNIFGLNIQENLYDGGLDFSGDWTKINVTSSALQDETHLGFPVMKITSTWARFYKVFPVESGKTYTFEAWFNADNTASVFLYLVAPNTENAATLSTGDRIQYNNQFEANKWNKISVTFTASTSGNISPYIAVSSGTGIKISRLVVVEGASVFDLSEADVQNIPKIYHVEKDGSGDFTSFVDAINAACGFMDSVVYVGAGEFDLLDELGASYVSSASATKRGLVFKNRVHVIGSSQTVLKMDYDGSLDNAKEYLSPINTGEYGCTIENIRVEDNNVRYSVHDDQGWLGSTPYINKYINCTFIHKNGKYGDCIGGGLGENCCIEIRGCYLEGDANVERLAYYHANNHTGITNAKGRLTVCDNYFANVGTFKMQKYGESTEMSTAYVSNNSFGSAPSVTSGSNSPIDNVEIIAWNNEIRA